MIRIGTQQDLLGESPVWSVEEQTLYWVDIRGKLVRRYREADGSITTFQMPELVGSIALRGQGRLLVALQSAIAFFDCESGELQRIAAPEASHAQRRFNDGKCDRQGRFWVGTMNDVTRAPEGTLYCFSGRNGQRAARSGIRIPNGLAFSPAGDVMYCADSDLRTIFRCDYDPESGEAGSPERFAEVTGPAVPDGATIDADGYLWSVEYEGGRVTRFAPDGKIDRVLPLPLRKPTSCAFGGSDLSTLFVTTATQGLNPDQLEQQPLAGGLLAIPMDVRGLPEPVFRD